MLKIIRRLTIFAALALALPLRADQVVMQNGDSFNGTVLSVNTNLVVLQNDNLGKVTLPRAKVSAIMFGTGAAKATAPLPAPAPAGISIRGPGASQTNAASDFASAFRGLRDQTNLIQQVQSQFLAKAGPDAIGKFNDLLDGLSTGKIDMNDLRAQAQSAADQLRSLKKDLGPDSSGEVDAYLAILDDFLQETAPANVATNSSSAATNAPVGP